MNLDLNLNLGTPPPPPLPRVQCSSWDETICMSSVRMTEEAVLACLPSSFFFGPAISNQVRPIASQRHMGLVLRSTQPHPYFTRFLEAQSTHAQTNRASLSFRYLRQQPAATPLLPLPPPPPPLHPNAAVTGAARHALRRQTQAAFPRGIARESPSTPAEGGKLRVLCELNLPAC